jgi:two-component system, NarL family, nitrate/nitrite response regulator NarL
MFRVAIVADWPVARHGIAAFVEQIDGVAVVAAVDEPTQFLAEGEHLNADLVIVSLREGVSEAQAQTIEALAKAASVLVISGSHPSVNALVEFVTAAAGPAQRLDLGLAGGSVNAVEPVQEPRTGTVTGGRGDPRSGAGVARPVLSPREKEALSYVANGYTHGQAASRMRVSKATVDTYIARIRAKLEVGNKAELALAALAHVEPEMLSRVARREYEIRRRPRPMVSTRIITSESHVGGAL